MRTDILRKQSGRTAAVHTTTTQMHYLSLTTLLDIKKYIITHARTLIWSQLRFHGYQPNNVCACHSSGYCVSGP